MKVFIYGSVLPKRVFVSCAMSFAMVFHQLLIVMNQIISFQLLVYIKNFFKTKAILAETKLYALLRFCATEKGPDAVVTRVYPLLLEFGVLSHALYNICFVGAQMGTRDNTILNFVI